MSEPILRVEGLTKRFGGLTAVDNVSLSFDSGQLHAIIGPNGAGKTTFFNLISGMLPCNAGRVYFGGHEITDLRPNQISRLGVKRTLQIKSVFSKLSVADNLWITAKAGQGFLHPFQSAKLDRDIKEKVDRTLGEMGLTALADRPAGTLSHGDMALLEIGMALIADPKLLLLDEPICGMSPAETESTVDKIRELSSKVDVIIIEHDMEVVFEIAHDITVMAQGGILARGTPQEISTNDSVHEAYLGRQEDDSDEEAAHA